MRRLTALAAALAALAATAAPASAQTDPRGPLRDLIGAFQMCGPPQVYQMLSPQLFQTIYQQTGGSGCYSDIAQAGAVTGLQVIDQQLFPVGAVSVVRVTHQSGVSADWFIGINEQTRRVELLTYQPAGARRPTIQGGPRPDARGDSPPAPSPGPSTPRPSTGDQPDGCDLYPAMC